MEFLHCHSCHMKQTSETPIVLYQVEEKLLCMRCAQLNNIYVSTTSDILGVPPDRLVAPLFKEISFPVTPQSLANFSSYLEPIKRQILLASREQVLFENGNAIIGATMNICKLENFQYLLCFSGTIVWSGRWDEMVRQRTPPIPVPFTPPAKKEEDEDDAVVVIREREKDDDRPVAGKYPDVGGSGQMNRFKKLVGNQ